MRTSRTEEARRARPDEVPALAAMLARAFCDDPFYEWMFPDERRRARRSRRFFEARLRFQLVQDEAYTTDSLSGAAVWTLPDEWRTPPREALREFVVLAPSFGRRLRTILRGFERIEERHPPEPHLYLSVLGVGPERQGQGIASALLAPTLAGCDRDEIPAYLESTKEHNVAFYARHGFRVTGELDLPEGPRVWLMWRDPRP